MDWAFGYIDPNNYTGLVRLRECIEALSTRHLHALIQSYYLDEYDEEAPSHQLCGDDDECTC